MAVEVMTWVWRNSRSKNAARLVLLAIADCARADGSHAFPSNAELRQKANASARAVQESIKSLVELGELEVRYNAGPGGVNLYRIVMTPAGSAPRRIRTPAESAGVNGKTRSNGQPPQNLRPPAESAPPQNSTPTPAESAGGTVRTVTTTKEASRPAQSTEGARQRATRLPEDFAVTDAMKAWALENVPRVNGPRETTKFINYWLAKSGSGATKTNWERTWQNWMLNADERLGGQMALTPTRPGPWRNPSDSSDYYGDI